jgi:hypothetical protein
MIFEEAEGGFDDGVLLFWIPRGAERESVGEGYEKRAGRAHAFRHFSKQINNDGRDAPPLQLRRHQTHGLITHGSDRDQK